MTSYEEYLEARKAEGEDKTYQLKAILEVAQALSAIFKKYTLNTRKEVWGKITGKKGEAAVADLIRNPDRPLSAFRNLT